MKKDEHIYTIPLRKAYDYKKSKRAKRAVDIVRAFVLRHAKVDDAIISMKTNEYIWSRSIEKPPRKIKVRVIRKDLVANVYLHDEKIEQPKPVETKKEEKVEKKDAKVETPKSEEKKPEVKKDEKKPAESKPKEVKEEKAPKVEKKETKPEPKSLDEKK